MQQLMNQAINRQERNNNSWYAAAETNQLEPMPSVQSNTISSELVPQAHRPLESGPRNAPLTQCVGSHPSHERCGHDGIPRAQHQTQMTVHVRKLNRGMNNNQSTSNQQQQKASPPGRNFKRIQEISIKLKLN
jgi:hypothetical protein